MNMQSVFIPAHAASLNGPPVVARHAVLDPASLDGLMERALGLYRVRVLDNVDLSKVRSRASRFRIVGRALMERGDARAFVMGRQLLAGASS